MSRPRDPLAGIGAVRIKNDRPVAKKEQVAVVERETAPPPPMPLPREVLDAPPTPVEPVEPVQEEAPPADPPPPSVAGRLGVALDRLFRRKKA